MARTITPIGCPFPFASTTSQLAGLGRPCPGTRSKNAPGPKTGFRRSVAPRSAFWLPDDRLMRSAKWAYAASTVGAPCTAGIRKLNGASRYPPASPATSTPGGA